MTEKKENMWGPPKGCKPGELFPGDPDAGKGIWQRMREMNAVDPLPISYEPFTLDTLRETIKALQNKPKRKPVMQLACSDYGFLTDDAFRVFIEWTKAQQYYDVTFIGGREGYDAMHARMSRLGITLD
jgi:hypothetical protein